MDPNDSDNNKRRLTSLPGGKNQGSRKQRSNAPVTPRESSPHQQESDAQADMPEGEGSLPDTVRQALSNLKAGRATLPSQSARSCSFCAKGENEIARLIAGPSAFICNECVRACVGMLKDRGEWDE